MKETADAAIIGGGTIAALALGEPSPADPSAFLPGVAEGSTELAIAAALA